MSDEYTITTRSEGLLGKIGQWGAALITDEELLEALDAHDAEVLREAVTELEYGIRLDAYPDADVVPVASEQRARAHATVGGVTAMQRTIRAGEWVPVKQEGAE